MALGTEDKKKIIALAGVAGALGIVGLIILNPFKGKGSGSSGKVAPMAMPTPPSMSSGSGSPGYASSSGSSASSEESTGTTTATTQTAATGTASAKKSQLISTHPFRPDPFEQYYTKPIPLPSPPPPPPTPRPIPTPLPPIDLPRPDANSDAGSNEGLPGLPGTSSPSQTSTALVGLPSPRIARYVTIPTAPRIQVPPPNVSGGEATVTRSANKRLAGVIIGDSVRALLEIDDGSGDEPKTQVVQPGDEVNGVRVLRIERYVEGGGRNRVRMIVRENGEERSVELRPSTSQTAAGGGGYPGGGGGYPGGGGGYPGGGGGYPGGGRRGGFGAPSLPDFSR